MLCRIRNSSSVGLDKVYIPYTKVNLGILHILKNEGFIDSFEKFDENKSASLTPNGILVTLKFKKGLVQKPYISFLKRVSKPGLRVYVNSHNIPTVWGGIGIAIF